MNRRVLLVLGLLAACAPQVHAADTARAPRADEVKLEIFQYATGDHPVPIACADNPPDGHVHNAPVYRLAVDRPFEYRIEPRWTGGSEPLDVIFEVKVDADIKPDDMDGDGFANQWSQLTHLGPQTRNREMAQVGQHVTLGSGPLLHPMPGFPILWHFRVDFQLGSQSGPKRVCEGRVLVERANS